MAPRVDPVSSDESLRMLAHLHSNGDDNGLVASSGNARLGAGTVPSL